SILRLTAHIADAGGGLHRVREILSLEPHRKVDEVDEHRHLDERAYHRRECLTRVDPEDRDSHRNCQLEVVGCGGKGKCGRLSIMGTHLTAHVKRDEEHDHEIDEKRNGDTNDIKRDLHNIFALEGEHHEDREKQGDKGDGTDLRDEPLV